MRKNIFVLLCLCTLLLPGFTNDDPDIIKAQTTLQTYFDAAIKGDIETRLNLATEKYCGAFVLGKKITLPFLRCKRC